MSDMDIDHVISLCRIQCSDREKEVLEENLRKILEYVEQLNEIDTREIEPCITVLPNAKNLMREDAPKGKATREEIIAAFPDQVGGMVRVPPVIDFEEEL